MITDAIVASGEVGRDRQRRIAGVAAEGGADRSDRYGPGTFGCHELLDRTALVAAPIEGQLLAQHPSCVADRERYALAGRAATALRELDRRIGAEHV